MTEDDKLFLERIGAYADEVMEESATEQNVSVEDVFIRYMDLASHAGVKKQEDFKNDYLDFDDLKI